MFYPVLKNIRRSVSGFARFVAAVSVALAGAMVLAPPALAQDGATIAEECSGCHGENGVSVEDDIPTIAGTSSFFIEEAMFSYQDEARPCRETEYRDGDTSRAATTMCAVAGELDEDGIAAISAHYGDLPYAAAKQEFDADKATVGAKIHKKDCEKCHADGGTNPDDDSGILAGQWRPFLEQAMADFKSGDREYLDEKMREKFEALGDSDFDALIHYYASQQ